MAGEGPRSIPPAAGRDVLSNGLAISDFFGGGQTVLVRELRDRAMQQVSGLLPDRLHPGAWGGVWHRRREDVEDPPRASDQVTDRFSHLGSNTVAPDPGAPGNPGDAPSAHGPRLRQRPRNARGRLGQEAARSSPIRATTCGTRSKGTRIRASLSAAKMAAVWPRSPRAS